MHSPVSVSFLISPISSDQEHEKQLQELTEWQGQVAVQFQAQRMLEEELINQAVSSSHGGASTMPPPSEVFETSRRIRQDLQVCVVAAWRLWGRFVWFSFPKTS